MAIYYSVTWRSPSRLQGQEILAMATSHINNMATSGLVVSDISLKKLMKEALLSFKGVYAPSHLVISRACRLSTSAMEHVMSHFGTDFYKYIMGIRWQCSARQTRISYRFDGNATLGRDDRSFLLRSKATEHDLASLAPSTKIRA